MKTWERSKLIIERFRGVTIAVVSQQCQSLESHSPVSLFVPALVLSSSTSVAPVFSIFITLECFL